MNNDLMLSQDEIDTILGDWIVQRYDADHPEWRDHLKKRGRELRWRLFKRQLFSFVPGVRRTQDTIDESYNEKWAERYFPSPSDAHQRRETSYFRDRDGGILAKVGGIPHVHLALIAKVLERLRPSKVIEIGCGYGTNLFSLAAAFPEIRFFGAELTEFGVSKAKSIAAQPILPEAVRRYTSLPLRDDTAYRRIEFTQATASNLPFKDNEFDLVFTRQALEQMNEIRDAAVSELTRIALKHVLMVESFTEFNRDPIRQSYIRSMDYFQMSIDELPNFGLTPVSVFDKFPSKVALGVQMVLAEKAADMAGVRAPRK